MMNHFLCEARQPLETQRLSLASEAADVLRRSPQQRHLLQHQCEGQMRLIGPHRF